MEATRLTREELMSALQLCDQQIEAYDSDKFSLYRPHDGKGGFDQTSTNGQIAFHKSNAKVRMMVCGNRSGKSEATCAEAIWLCLGTHPYHKRKIPCKGKMYGESYPVLMFETLIPKFKKWLPKDSLDQKKPYMKSQQGYITGINFANGSTISFGAYAQDEGVAEGGDCDFVAFDEPPPRSLYIANIRGLVDRGGICWFSMTPLKEAWIFDEIFSPGVTKTKSYIDCFTWSSYDNPYVNKESIDMFASELTPEEHAVRIEGHFKRLQGLVIKTYDPSLSDIEPFPLTDKFSIYEGLDPHTGKPNCALWKAIDKEGYRYAVAELKFDGGIYDFGQEIAAMREHLRRDGANIVCSVSDTSINQKDMMFKINMKDELYRSLRDAGEDVMPKMANKRDWLLPGINKLIDLFRPIEREGGFKSPTESLFRDCVPNYKYGLLHYQWPEKVITGTVTPIKEHDDFIDPSRYIESLAPKFQTPGQKKLLHTYNGAYVKRESKYTEMRRR